FGALDAQVRRELRKWLREIHERTGHTTIFVTHDQEEALELADRLCVMSQGRIEQVGTPDSVYDHPASPFVFGFIGESSQLPVNVERGDVWLGDRPIGIAAPEKQGDARLFFRPHDIELVEDGAALSGVVAASRRVGGIRRVELDIGGAAHRVEIDLPFDHPAGERSQLTFRPKRWTLFAAEGRGRNMISQKARYALRALLALARPGHGRPLMISQIAAEQKIPKKFLEQILLELKAGGLVQSRRGRTGGYELIRPPEEVTFGDVLRL